MTRIGLPASFLVRRDWGDVGGDDGGGLLGRQLAGQGGRGHLRLVGHPSAGVERTLGGGGAHPGVMGELVGGGAIAIVLPAVGLGRASRCERLDRGGGRLDLGAQPYDVARLARAQGPGVELAGITHHRLSKGAELTHMAVVPTVGTLSRSGEQLHYPGRRTADDPAGLRVPNVCSTLPHGWREVNQVLTCSPESTVSIVPSGRTRSAFVPAGTVTSRRPR